MMYKLALYKVHFIRNKHFIKDLTAQSKQNNKQKVGLTIKHLIKFNNMLYIKQNSQNQFHR